MDTQHKKRKDDKSSEESSDVRESEVQLNIEADLDEMSEFSESDELDEDLHPANQQKWSEYYMAQSGIEM